MFYIYNAPRKCIYLVGIDEVGRGPIAGPVAVAAVLLYSKGSYSHFEGIKDSKKLSPLQRENWFNKITQLKDEQLLDFAVSFVGNEMIDKCGIVHSTQSALARALEQICVEPDKIQVLLDGGLIAPTQFQFQETIIKGDEKEPLIAAASIIAKVTRDQLMTNVIDARYPGYGFASHKGYGSQMHLEAIERLGPCSIHRMSFAPLRNRTNGWSGDG